MTERGSMDPTPTPLGEFLAAYEADDNEWWRAQCGDHQNWFDEAVDRMQAAETKLAGFERVGCITPDGEVMRGHFGPCESAGHRPIYQSAVAGSATPTGEDGT